MNASFPIPRKGAALHTTRELSTRQRRVGEQIRAILTEALRAGACYDPAYEGLLFSITEVRMTRDLRAARVFVSALGTPPVEPALVIAYFRAHLVTLRKSIAQAGVLRYVPTLYVLYDDHATRANAMQTVWDRLASEMPPEDELSD